MIYKLIVMTCIFYLKMRGIYVENGDMYQNVKKTETLVLLIDQKLQKY